MLSEESLKYLSVAGSICSIIALVITVTAKLDIESGVCIVVSIFGAVFFAALLLWLMNQFHEQCVAKLHFRELSWFYYFIAGIIAIVLVLGFFLLLWSVLSLLLTGFITALKEGLAYFGES